MAELNTPQLKEVTPVPSNLETNINVDTTDGLSPVTPYYGKVLTPREVLEGKEQQEARIPNALEWIGTSIQHDWISPWLFTEKKEAVPDSNFLLNEETLRDVMKDVPFEYWDRFDDAVSVPHAYGIRKGILDRLKVEEDLMSVGWGAIPARMLVTLTDPLVIGGIAGTWGLGSAYFGVGGGIAGRLMHLATLGSLTGIEAAAFMGIQADKDPLYDDDDVEFAALLGFGLGGGIGAFTARSGINRVLQRRIDKSSGQLQLTETGQALLNKTKNFDPYTPNIDKAFLKSDTEQWYKSLNETLKQDKVSDLRVLARERNIAGRSKMRKNELIDALKRDMGAERDEIITVADRKSRITYNRAARTKEKIKADSSPNGFDDVPWQGMGLLKFGKRAVRMRYGPAAILKNNENGAARFLGRIVFADAAADVQRAAGKSTLAPAVDTVEEVIRRQGAQSLAHLRTAENKLLKEHFKVNKSGWVKKATGAREGEVFENVAALVRSGNIDQAPDGVVKNIAKLHRDYYRNMLKWGKEQGIKGLDDVPINEMYIPRIYSLRRIEELRGSLKSGELDRLIASALKIDGLDPADALRLGRAFMSRVHNRLSNHNLTNLSVLGDDVVSDMRGALRELLGEDEAALADKLADVIEANFKKKKPESGRIARAKSRLPLDENHTLELVHKDGTKAKYSLQDLLENDARTLQMRYDRQLRGAAQMNRVINDFSEKAGKELKTFSDVKRIVLDGTPSDAKTTKKVKDVLEFTEKAILGKPFTPPSGWKNAATAIRDFNYWRIGGSFGIASIPETAYPIVGGTFRAFTQQMPMFRKITSDARSGKLSKDALRDFHYLTGSGTDRLTMQFTGRVDDLGVLANTRMSRNSAMREKLNRTISDVSGLNWLTRNQQEMMSQVAFQNFVNDALGTTGKTISRTRYYQLGIDDEMFGRITKMLKDPKSGIVIDEIKGLGKVVDPASLNRALHSATDQEAVSSLISGIQKFTESTIQRTYIGDLPLWMSSELGKLMGQFRTYVMTSWNRQLMPGMQRLGHGDFTVVRDWSALMLFGGLTYTLQTYLKTIGDPEKRKEYLEPMEIAKGAFARAGVSGVIPGAVDTGGYLFGADPLFRNVRSSGLASQFLTGSPTFQGFDLLTRSIRGVNSSIFREDTDLSEKDLKSIKRLLPFSNVPVISQSLDYGIENVGLPEKSKSRENEFRRLLDELK